MDKLTEAYTQTIQAGVVGIAAMTILLAIALVIIIFMMLKDGRIRDNRRAEEHATQVAFNQGLTAATNQISASISSVPNVLAMVHASLEAGNQRAEKFMAAIQPSMDDTKTRLQALIESHATLHGKVDTLPSNIVSTLEAKINTIDIALQSAKNVLELVRNADAKPASE